ncbi:MAG: succinylglutamate desuccinylase/aspartoacylase family protein [Flavobacteriaceae bacterium]
MKYFLFFVYLLLFSPVFSQNTFENISEINLEKIPNGQVKKYWLTMIDNGFSQPVSIPVMIFKGKEDGPVLGLIAAIHGNELNGIKVIQESVKEINVSALKGTVIAIPGINALSIGQDRRRFIDEEDLNRNFPGKANGNRSQQYVWQINQKILPKLDYLIDMHTASFGRINSLYVRGELGDEKISKMALLQDADIVLNNKGVPSAGDNIAATRTMRAQAMLKGIPTITVEYGNPQVYQDDMVKRGVVGVKNVMNWLGMQSFTIPEIRPAVMCKKSYWVYVDQGGLLDIPVQLNQIIEKGELIGVLRNPFGDVIKEYFAPEKGIVIGKSTNPVNIDGGRIIHLGILED